MILGKIFDELTSDETKGPNTGPPSSGFADGDAYVDRGTNDKEEGANKVAQSDEGTKAGKALANITRDELKNYLDTYGKTEEQMLADTNSTAMIDSAKGASTLGQQVSQGMQQRTLGRYGASMTPAQMASQQRMNSLGNASSYAGAVNNSAIDQRDRNFGLKAQLMGMGKEQLNVALGGLSSAASMEADRENAYQQARAGAYASNMQMLGTIIGFGM